MDNLINLNDLSVGQNCVVVNVNNTGIMRRRLMDIGIVPGCLLSCVLDSPSGNPRCYLVKGSLIALRNCDSCLIEVKLL